MTSLGQAAAGAGLVAVRSLRLSDLVAGLPGISLSGPSEVEVCGIAHDSRLVRPGDLFVCINGFRVDGHRFAAEAIARGAAALVVEREVDVSPAVPIVQVRDARRALGTVAARWYGDPSAKLRLVGITGTEGKTTTAHLLDAILRAAGRRVGLIGTIVNRVGGSPEPATLTTPDALDLQRMLRACVDAGVQDVVLEVSSHALALGRVEGCHFDAGLFTNLTSDHLDLHGDFPTYLAIKTTLFRRLGSDPVKASRAVAILNADDPNAWVVRECTRCPVLTFGVDRGAHVMARNIEASLRYLRFVAQTPEGAIPVVVRLGGRFNGMNALAAIAAALGLGVNLATIQRGLASLAGIPGRFDLVEAGQDFLVIVDFAHTASAYTHLLTEVRRFARGRVITVFGCPGDRDRSNRPAIGAALARLSDFAIITADNPASEHPGQIAEEIEAGMEASGRRRPLVVLDRAEAIRWALALAGPGDAVVLAGKGHEEYQLVGDARVPHSDRAAAKEILRQIRQNR